MTPSQYITYFRQIATEHKEINFSPSNKSFVRGTINEYLDNLVDFEGDGPFMFLEFKTGALSDSGDNPFDVPDFAFMILVKTEMNDADDMASKLDQAFNIGTQICARIKRDAIAFHDEGNDSLFQSFDFSTVRYQKVGAKGDAEHGYRFSGKLPAAIDLSYDETKWWTES